MDSISSGGTKLVSIGSSPLAVLSSMSFTASYRLHSTIRFLQNEKMLIIFLSLQNSIGMLQISVRNQCRVEASFAFKLTLRDQTCCVPTVNDKFPNSPFIYFV